MSEIESLLDHPAISGCYLFPQPRRVAAPQLVQVDGAELACYRRIVDPARLTLIHFHGNGEAVADYVPWMADILDEHGLNSLFVEYREYGGSTGRAQLCRMLGDGATVLEQLAIPPERAIAFGRSIGSLYAIELAYRRPTLAGLVLESGIADPAERFLTYADLSDVDFDEDDVATEASRRFNHQRKLAECRNPLLILHAKHDDLVDVSHAERNFRWSASSQKRLVTFDRGDHNSIMSSNRAEYFAALRIFFDGIKAERGGTEA